MQAYEFEIDAENDVIRIPERYKILYSKHLRVVAMFEGKEELDKEKKPSLIEELLKNPLGVENFTPLTRDETHAR